MECNNIQPVFILTSRFCSAILALKQATATLILYSAQNQKKGQHPLVHHGMFGTSTEILAYRRLKMKYQSRKRRFTI